jgi:transcriptional regulator with XRE-family HTH domain
MGGHLGKAFRELRDELGLSQSEIARRTKDKGVSRPTVVLMEQGKRVRLETVVTLASAMGASRTQRTDLVLAWLRDSMGAETWRQVMSALRR